MKNSIKSKLTASFLFVLIIPLLIITVISVYVLQGIVAEKVNDKNRYILRQAATNIDRIFLDMRASAVQLIGDSEVQQIMNPSRESPQMAGLDKYIYAKKVRDKIYALQSTLLKNYPGVVVALSDRSEQTYSNFADSGYETEVFRQIRERERVGRNENGFRWSEVDRNLGGLPQFTDKPYLVYFVTYINAEGIGIGDMLVGIPQTHVTDILDNMGTEDEGASFIFNERNRSFLGGGKIAAAHLADWIKQPVSDRPIRVANRNYYVNTIELESLNRSYLVQMYPKSAVSLEISIVRNGIILASAVCLLLFLAISYLIAGKITVPVKKLNSAVKEFSRGNMDVSIDPTGKDELGILAQNFNRMATEIKALVEKEQSEQKAKRELELQALYAQINPHFLFNTLNSIRWMADASKVYNVSKVIVALANLLRNSILQKNERIPFQEEVENTRNYILIQKMRYGLLFDDIYEIPKELEAFKVPKLILQPIVENCILHGFDGIDYKGQIRISAVRFQDHIRIEVVDNGKGMDAAALSALLERERSPGKGMNSIGLRNVNDRLAIQFGEAYRLEVESAPGEGTKVAFAVPTAEAGEEEIAHVQAADRR